MNSNFDENLVLTFFVLIPVVSATILFLLKRPFRPSRRLPSWLKLAIGNLSFLLFFSSLLALAGEVYYRFFYDTTDSFAFTKVSRRWIERYWHANANSVRDNIEYSPFKVAAKRRVTFFGDSFTAAHGVKSVEDRFANRLRAANPSWEIHVLAMPGADTGEELELLKSCIRNGYQLENVVLVYCLNDISDIIPGWTQTLDQINARAGAGGWLRRNSFLVNTLYYRLKRLHDPNLGKYYPFVRDAYHGDLWEQQKKRLREFKEVVDAHNGRLAVVTFPFFQSLGPNYEYRFAHDELGQFWQALGIPHLDLFTVYQDIPAKKLMVNPLDPHPNEYAHRLAAEAIDGFLKKELVK